MQNPYTQIKQTTTFLTTDGQSFNDLTLAIDHQRTLNFIDWYKECPNSPTDYGGEMATWLKKYKDEILCFFGDAT